jgi:hypothetical protein
VKSLIGIPALHDISAPKTMLERFSISRCYLTTLEGASGAPVLFLLAIGADILRSSLAHFEGSLRSGCRRLQMLNVAFVRGVQWHPSRVEDCDRTMPTLVRVFIQAA